MGGCGGVGITNVTRRKGRERGLDKSHLIDDSHSAGGSIKKCHEGKKSNFSFTDDNRGIRIA